MATNNAWNSNIPVSIAQGGTNATTMTNADGVVYFDGTILNTTTVGVAGQVLTSNGPAVAPTFQAASGGGGWALIQTNNLVASSGVTFTTGITNAYNVFVITIASMTTSGSASYLLQLSSNGGSSYISSGYNSTWNRWQYNSGSPSSNGTSTNAFTLTESNTGYVGGATLYLYNFTNGSFPTFQGNSVWANTTTGVFSDQSWGIYHTATVMNAFQIIPSTGDTLTAEISLYGISK